jgi:hypothetical protein
MDATSATGYSLCHTRVGSWKGYFVALRSWTQDLDNSYKLCHWRTVPIKVTTVSKGLWKDDTVKTVTTIVTSKKLS